MCATLGRLFPVMINGWVSPGDEPEGERGSEGEHREEEHLKCGYAETGGFDEIDNGRILNSGIRYQHPKIADRNR